MPEGIPERDWKYMRKIKSSLLNEFAGLINQRSVELLSGDVAGEHDKYRALYQHIQNSDEVIAECFDDWRRSTILFRILALDRHRILKQGQLKKLSEETQAKIKAIEELNQ